MLDLKRGQSGLIEELVGCPTEINRLNLMGVRPGATVKMVKPGSICIVKVNHSLICYRGNVKWIMGVLEGQA